mmetsp:Transcript_65224/g.96445  ORF Transcript_65224/g.96445 Transcript_65224/m.96445 type:complete len:180 (-) Transcript_65224:669-1208(-)
MDPEQQQSERVGLVSGDGGDSSGPQNPYKQTSMSPNHPFYQIKRSAIVGASLYGLHYMKVYHTILRHSKFDHVWFKIGLACCVALLALKSYVELYQGKTKKIKVRYENFKQETHTVMILMLLISIAFHKSLWAVHGAGETMFIMFLFGCICLNTALMMPPWAWNLLAVVLLTLFIQMYV